MVIVQINFVKQFQRVVVQLNDDTVVKALNISLFQSLLKL